MSSSGLHEKDRQTSTKKNLRDSQLFKSGTIFIAMSEGDEIEEQNESSIDSVQKQQELLYDKFENDLFVKAQKKETADLQSLPFSMSNQEFMSSQKKSSKKFSNSSNKGGTFGSLNMGELRIEVRNTENSDYL
jgi:hypothetical protein